MSKWICKYQWYETVVIGFIEARDEYQAKVRFVIKELKGYKKRGLEPISHSDFCLDEDESLKKQIKELAKDEGLGLISCYPADEEFVEEFY